MCNLIFFFIQLIISQKVLIIYLENRTKNIEIKENFTTFN